MTGMKVHGAMLQCNTCCEQVYVHMQPLPSGPLELPAMNGLYVLQELQSTFNVKL